MKNGEADKPKEPERVTLGLVETVWKHSTSEKPGTPAYAFASLKISMPPDTEFHGTQVEINRLTLLLNAAGDLTARAFLRFIQMLVEAEKANQEASVVELVTQYIAGMQVTAKTLEAVIARLRKGGPATSRIILPGPGSGP